MRTRIALTPLIAGAQVTVSLGVTEYRSGEHFDDWLKRTDDNLYRAKDSGRNCVYAGNDTDTAPKTPASKTPENTTKKPATASPQLHCDGKL